MTIRAVSLEPRIHAGCVSSRAVQISHRPDLPGELVPDQLHVTLRTPGELLQRKIDYGFQKIGDAFGTLHDYSHDPAEYLSHLNAAKNIADSIKIPPKKLHKRNLPEELVAQYAYRETLRQQHRDLVQGIAYVTKAHEAFVRARNQNVSIHNHGLRRQIVDTTKAIFKGKIRDIHISSVSPSDTPQQAATLATRLRKKVRNGLDVAENLLAGSSAKGEGEISLPRTKEAKKLQRQHREPAAIDERAPKISKPLGISTSRNEFYAAERGQKSSALYSQSDYSAALARQVAQNPLRDSFNRRGMHGSYLDDGCSQRNEPEQSLYDADLVRRVSENCMNPIALSPEISKTESLFLAMPSEIKAKIYSHLPLEDISRGFLLNRGLKAEYPEMVSWLGSKGDQLGSIALHKVISQGNGFDQSGQRAKPEFHDEFMKFISTLRDESFPEKRSLDTERNLLHPAFFETCALHAFGNENILRRLIETWPLLPKNARQTACLQLKAAIGENCSLQADLDNQMNAHVRIHATDESADSLGNLAYLADHPLRLEEKIALAKHPNADNHVIGKIAQGAEDPTLRLLVLQNPLLPEWVLDGISPRTLDERLAIIRHPNVTMVKLSHVAEDARDPNERFEILNHKLCEGITIANLADTSSNTEEKIAIASHPKAKGYVLRTLIRGAKPEEEYALMDIYRRYCAAGGL